MKRHKNIPTWVIVRFMECDKFDAQKRDKATLIGCPYHLLFVDLEVINILITI